MLSTTRERMLEDSSTFNREKNVSNISNPKIDFSLVFAIE